MIDEILNNIQARIVAFFGGFHIVIDPIYEWYFFGFLAFVGALVVGYFLPFKWVRAGLGVFLLLVGAYIAGGRQMHGEMAKEIAKSKVKPKPARLPAPEADHSIFSNWFG